MTLPAYWSSFSPRARAVVWFGGLGLAYTLMQAVATPSEWDFLKERIRWPLTHPLGLALRVGFAGLSAGVLLWAVRPGRRTPPEFALLAAFGAVFAAVTTLASIPGAFLMVIPVALRYWWSLRRTLLASLVLIVLSLLAGPPLSGQPLVTADDWLNFTALALWTLGLFGFSFTAFELTLRREEDRAELRAALRELRQYHGLELQHAALEERTRISRELHDTLGHSLTALRLEVQRARRLTGQPQELGASLERAQQRSGEAMDGLQAAVRALRPALPGGALYEAVRALVDAWPVPVTLQLHGHEPPLSAAARLAAFRTVQEALTNAHKHAPGQEVTVELQSAELQSAAQGSSALNLKVTNALRGDSADSSNAPDSGSGLSGLKDRVREVGGELHVTRLPGTFEVRLYLPVEAA